MAFTFKHNVSYLLFLLSPLIFIGQNFQANFSHQSIQDSACHDVLVQFDDLSTGNVTSWQWDFGDTTAISNVQHPQHVFRTGGFYTILLIVSDGTRSDTLKKQITVTTPSFDATYTIVRLQVPGESCYFIVQCNEVGALYNWCTGALAPTIFVHGPRACVTEVLDINGCVDHDTVLIGVFVEAEITHASFSGVADGSILLLPSNGTQPFQPFSYLWNTGDTTAFLGNLFPGTYTVTISDSAKECVNMYSYTIQADSLNLDLDNDLNTRFKLFPNPGHDEVIIQSESRIDELSLFSLNGKQLDVDMNQRNPFMASISTHSLDKGMYIIRIFADNGYVYRKWLKR